MAYSATVLQPVAVRYILAEPGKFMVRAGRRLVGWFSAFTETKTKNEYTNRRTELLAAISFYPVLALACVGAIVGWRRERLLIYLVVGGLTAVHAVLTVTTRYRLPIDPYLMIFAAVAVDWVLTRR